MDMSTLVWRRTPGPTMGKCRQGFGFAKAGMAKQSIEGVNKRHQRGKEKAGEIQKGRGMIG
eukprot:1157108-Pelagomonas_calceolata.AAC.7